MKITLALVAAASFAATLSAQTPIQVTSATNVTIGGLLAVGIKNSTISPASGNNITETYLGDNTSRLTIMSTSSMGDGWNVLFRLGCRFEPTYGPGTTLLPGISALNSATTSTYGGLAEDDTWGGISSPYGTVTFGKSTLYITDSVDMSYLGVPSAGEAYRIWDANGLAVFNILDNVNEGAGTNQTLGITRSQGVLQYISPKFSDFQVQVAWSKNPYGSALQYSPFSKSPTTGPGGSSFENGDTIYAKGQYNKGPLSAFVSLLNIKAQGGATAGTQDEQAWRAGVSWKQNGFKVGVVADHSAFKVSESGSSIGRTAFMVPVSYNWDKHGVYATYSVAGNSSTGSTTMNNTGASQINLVYDYALTSRAFIGLFYAGITNKSAGTYGPFLSGTNLGPSSNNVVFDLAPGSNWHQIGINMNYWF